MFSFLYFHFNPRWVYGVFRDFFFWRIYPSFFSFLFIPLLCLLILFHLAFFSFPLPKALDHSRFSPSIRVPHGKSFLAFTLPSIARAMGLEVLWFLRVSLEIVTYICSTFLFCSGRRYGLLFCRFRVTLPAWHLYGSADYVIFFSNSNRFKLHGYYGLILLR
jgi:hypothetical protein